jgi:hypothetical protein
VSEVKNKNSLVGSDVSKYCCLGSEFKKRL